MNLGTNSWLIKVWANGKTLDLWHVNHLLAGVLLGGVTYFYSLNVWQGLLVSAILIFGWEIYEIIRKVYETQINRALDILLGFLGFALFYNMPAIVSSDSYLLLFECSIILWLFLEVWGFWAYHQRRKLGIRRKAQPSGVIAE